MHKLNIVGALGKEETWALSRMLHLPQLNYGGEASWMCKKMGVM